MTSHTFSSFGRCASGRSLVEAPRDVDEVQQVFRSAAAENRRVTIRGAGHSFDGQAVQEGDTGWNVVLLTSAFTDISFPSPNLVRVGAGARWSDILAQSLSRELIPAIIQTAGAATAGGTLAGDCLSRFSGALGKESAWIESFTLVPVIGEALRCSRAENADVFHAAIGGHGYLGFVTDITYNLLELPAGFVAQTEVTTFRSLEQLVEAQMSRAQDASHLAEAARGQLAAVRKGVPWSPLSATSTIRAVSSVAFESSRSVKGAVFESCYTAPANPPLPPFPLYNNLHGGLRYAAEQMARKNKLNRLFHESLFALLEAGNKRFEDDIHEFSFFMDGNTFAKERFEREHPGRVFPITQQTFVVPEAETERFATECMVRMKARKITPTEIDLLLVAEDECLMSATYKKRGFAFSVAFENYDAPCPPKKIDALFRELSVLCADMGGRIHLVKNLRADKAVVRRMFDQTIGKFETLKARLDPTGVLRNAFFDKIFDLQIN